MKESVSIFVEEPKKVNLHTIWSSSDPWMGLCQNYAMYVLSSLSLIQSALGVFPESPFISKLKMRNLKEYVNAFQKTEQSTRKESLSLLYTTSYSHVIRQEH